MQSWISSASLTLALALLLPVWTVGLQLEAADYTLDASFTKRPDNRNELHFTVFTRLRGVGAYRVRFTLFDDEGLEILSQSQSRITGDRLWTYMYKTSLIQPGLTVNYQAEIQVDGAWRIGRRHSGLVPQDSGRIDGTEETPDTTVTEGSILSPTTQSDKPPLLTSPEGQKTESTSASTSSTVVSGEKENKEVVIIIVSTVVPVAGILGIVVIILAVIRYRHGRSSPAMRPLYNAPENHTDNPNQCSSEQVQTLGSIPSRRSNLSFASSVHSSDENEYAYVGPGFEPLPQLPRLNSKFSNRPLPPIRAVSSLKELPTARQNSVSSNRSSKSSQYIDLTQCESASPSPPYEIPSVTVTTPTRTANRCYSVVHRENNDSDATEHEPPTFD